MNHVLVKVKGNGKDKKQLFKLLSDKTLYEDIVVDLGSCVDYSPDHNLDEDSWFKIHTFSEKPYCQNFLKSEFVAAEYDDLPKDLFVQMAYLLGVQGVDVFFQKITPSQFLTKKMIAFGEAAKLEVSDSRLVVNSQPDAIYFKNEDVLIFRSLATISSIFKGVDELYKEATDDEVKDFMNEPFVSLKDNFEMSKVSKPNRKRIALAMDTLKNMSDEDRKSMLGYVGSYCSEKLKIDEELSSVQISNDNELKFLLYGIEQRFYTTPFGKERRLANSVQPI